MNSVNSWVSPLFEIVLLMHFVLQENLFFLLTNVQRLTGGQLLSRNKDFLVYYRGKDFLSPDVTEALLEKERLAKAFLDEEEQARLRASCLVVPGVEEADESGIAGTLKETLDADNRWGKQLDDDHKEKVMREAEVLRHANIVRKLEKKLDFVSFISQFSVIQILLLLALFIKGTANNQGNLV